MTSSKQWPPPGFPIVEGEHALTPEWSIHLPDRFARRVEDGSLVLWRPGLTMWLETWRNDVQESQEERLAWIKESASPDRFAERVQKGPGVTRFSYRLRDENEDGPVESLYAFVIGDHGHVQIAIYFDDPEDEVLAGDLVDRFMLRNP